MMGQRGSSDTKLCEQACVLCTKKASILPFMRYLLDVFIRLGALEVEARAFQEENVLLEDSPV